MTQVLLCGVRSRRLCVAFSGGVEVRLVVHTWQSLHGFVGGGMRAVLGEKVASSQLEVAKQGRWKLPIQPPTERLLQ